ncbi:MAG: 50S ribosomal protein L39e [Candidatus Micrarchaeota archaeon]|nr:50S ribosomal protein L39e [Candidatus Micrarchaeota archaeon]
MSVSKSNMKKMILGKHKRMNRRIPLFVIAKTHRKIIQNKFRRNWRTDKLKIKIK